MDQITSAEIYIPMAVIMTLLCLTFAWFIYDKDVRRSIIMQDAEEDFQDLKKRLATCHPSDGERLIQQFEEKWARYLMPWTLSNYTHALYVVLLDRDIRAALN